MPSTTDNDKEVAMLIDIDELEVINDPLGTTRVTSCSYRSRRDCPRLCAPVTRWRASTWAQADPRRGLDDALALAQRLSTAWSTPFALEGSEVTVTGSTGIALSPKRGADAATLLREADAAMYRAKDQGQGHVALYDDHMRALIDA